MKGSQRSGGGPSPFRAPPYRRRFQRPASRASATVPCQTVPSVCRDQEPVGQPQGLGHIVRAEQHTAPPPSASWRSSETPWPGSRRPGSRGFVQQQFKGVLRQARATITSWRSPSLRGPGRDRPVRQHRPAPWHVHDAFIPGCQPSAGIGPRLAAQRHHGAHVQQRRCSPFGEHDDRHAFRTFPMQPGEFRPFNRTSPATPEVPRVSVCSKVFLPMPFTPSRATSSPAFRTNPSRAAAHVPDGLPTRSWYGATRSCSSHPVPAAQQHPHHHRCAQQRGHRVERHAVASPATTHHEVAGERQHRAHEQRGRQQPGGRPCPERARHMRWPARGRRPSVRQKAVTVPASTPGDCRTARRRRFTRVPRLCA